jgi:large subunit ribosomal protein L6
VSRIGKRPVKIPENVEVSQNGDTLTVKGPKGTLTKRIARNVEVQINEGEAVCTPPGKGKKFFPAWGMSASILKGMIIGVTEGFKKQLEIKGVGYKADVKGRDLVLSVGYSHPVTIQGEENITFRTDGPLNVEVGGVDKERVGEVAAKIRATRPVEPYKGKGIRYVGEHVIRKAGKSGVK